MHRFALLPLLALGVGVLGDRADAVTIFQPDSATASSEFSGSYVIENTINGTGLPVGFGPGDAHATYVQGNHWTTRANQVPGATANYFFNSPVTIGTFYMWNHRSDGVASNSNYEVTLFDLELKDGGGGVLLSLTDLVAAGETPTAQAFGFAPVSGVEEVVFTIKDNQGLGVNSTNYTGLAEVAFSSESPIPEPASLLMLLSSAALAAARRR